MKCEFCNKRKSVGKLVREIGFGVVVTMGQVCGKCRKAIVR